MRASLVRAPETVDHGAELTEKFVRKTARVGVVGAGYVGLPLAVEKAKVGFDVVAYDRNAARVDQVNRGESYIGDVSGTELAAVVRGGKLSATCDFASLQSCDAIVICVPTPLTANRDPNLTYVRAVGAEIARVVRPGQLICLESTTYPGTTQDVLLPQISQGDLIVGQDFFLAFSPERVDPGNARYTTKNTNKVVGGVTPACTKVASVFYAQTLASVVPVSSPAVAEMTKVFENTFRAVNIALVNEMALLCDRMNLSIWEVVDAAATKPFGIMRFEPGPGVGGHCIPIDPFYLTWKARELDFHTRFIELAGEINVHMPAFTREKIARALNRRGKPLRDARILAIGVAYKRDLDDYRESPALKVIELLERDLARVDYHDPFVPQFEDSQGVRRRSVALTPQTLSEADCVVVLCDHSGIDWEGVVRHAPLVVDARNATRRVTGRDDKVVLL
ncbi:MAG TPA: nucleotide sugar dehydrogenase [Candidatus Tumulicola sp.]|nr:nucleotide sugar dehydrogenase [Candidatus Tumulicola sp.]